MITHIFRLYVAGGSSNSLRAIENLTTVCEKTLAPEQFDIDVVDVLEHPGAAEQEGIVATPTLVRQLPSPQLRIVGDLRDHQDVIMKLELDQTGHGGGA